MDSRSSDYKSLPVIKKQAFEARCEIKDQMGEIASGNLSHPFNLEPIHLKLVCLLTPFTAPGLS